MRELNWDEEGLLQETSESEAQKLPCVIINLKVVEQALQAGQQLYPVVVVYLKCTMEEYKHSRDSACSTVSNDALDSDARKAGRSIIPRPIWSLSHLVSVYILSI